MIVSDTNSQRELLVDRYGQSGCGMITQVCQLVSRICTLGEKGQTHYVTEANIPSSCYFTATWPTWQQSASSQDTEIQTQTVNNCAYTTWVAWSLQNLKNRSSNKWEFKVSWSNINDY